MALAMIVLSSMNVSMFAETSLLLSPDDYGDYPDYWYEEPDDDALAENPADMDKERVNIETFETFTLSDRKQIVQAGDIRLQLTKTDVKKRQYNIKVTVDGGTTEKKNQKINEPLRFFAGNNRLSHEVFINWVTRNGAGGYLRISNDTEAPREQYSANTPDRYVPAKNNSRAQTANRRTTTGISGGSMIPIYVNGVAVPVEYDRNTGTATIPDSEEPPQGLHISWWSMGFFTTEHLLRSRGWIVRVRHPSGLFFTRRNGRWGLDDASGNEIAPPIYNSLMTLSDDLIGARREDKFGIIDIWGDEVAPANFEYRDMLIIRNWYANSRERELPENVVLSHWSEVKPILPLRTPLKIVDVYTGITYYVASFSNGNHADVETVTAQDTALFLEARELGSGRPPVWVTIRGTTYAAALYDVIHGGSTIPDNNMEIGRAHV